MTKEEIRERAKLMVRERRDSREYLCVCMEASLCPECGNRLEWVDSSFWSVLLFGKCGSAKCSGCGLVILKRDIGGGIFYEVPEKVA